MSSNELINELKSQSCDKYKGNVVKMGIPEASCIGVSTAAIRKLSKLVKRSNEIAYELWDSGYHEAKLLAVLLFEIKKLTCSDIERLMNDVVSWDLCDHICKNLIIKADDYETYIFKWITSSSIYMKRASFTLIATAVIHKELSDCTIDTYLKLIMQNSDNEHNHVKKAVSWSLREIGKKDFNFNEAVILLSHDLMKDGNKAQKWIAKDVLKELENVVKSDGRKRLISTGTQMGGEL